MLSAPAAVVTTPVSRHGWLLHAAVLLSGFAGLGYQMAWTRMLSVSLGHEFTAVLAVVAAFFVGLALGGLLLNARLRNTQSPLTWYLVLEVVIGAWALMLIFTMPHYNQWTAQLIGSQPDPLWHWLVAFTATLLVLLPATFAMGATLPAALQLAKTIGQTGPRVAGLYAINTAGACVGTLLATYYLLPSLGLNRTLILFAAINFGIAALLSISLRGAVNKNAASLNEHTESETPTGAAKPVLPLLFFTGFLGLGYEILVVRVLAQILEGTVYSFAAILSLYLMGTAIGAALYQRSQRAGPIALQNRFAPYAVDRFLLAAVALACLLGSGLLSQSQWLYDVVLTSLGPSNWSAMLAELSVASMVFLIPTLCMGALFSHLAQRASGNCGLGLAMGVNTLGAAGAPVLLGVVLLPKVGALTALVMVAAGYGVLTWLLPRRRFTWRYNLPVALGALVLFVLVAPLRFVAAPAGSQLLQYQEGVIAAVAVVEEPDQSRHLKVNNRFTMGGTASRFSDHRQTHLPLLWQGGNAEQVLYLGLGTGITFQAAQYYPKLRVTAVELIPEMISLMPYFGVDAAGDHWPNRPRLLAADARRFVVADTNHYDVIIAEVFHPSRDGAGSLYTVEHFNAVRQRLAPGGVFCQWLPLFQLDLSTLRSITGSFLAVFPNAQMHLAHYSLQQPLLCLLGGDGLKGFGEDWLQERVHNRALQQQLVQSRLNSDFALLGGFIAGPEGLRSFSQGVPLNTDDFPWVVYQAPSFVYGQPEPPAQRLLALVEQLSAQRGTLLASEQRGSVFDQRLQAYWQARDHFLAAGVGANPDVGIKEMIAQTRGPLLEAVALSPDFLPAYDPVLQMAQAVYNQDPLLARELLLALDKANPTLPDARELLARMFPPKFGSLGAEPRAN
ncbi:hypothetical protein GCM10025791_29070 [Halioxenophilus aromaticivorans]|uniref:Spermidine synthase n=1 Tax=Halioxenophilus aromaticivorans TaxID=1306992 RepID=A0AAV3U5Q7_9ALTE